MPSDLGLSTALGWHGENPKKLDLIDINPSQVQSQTIAGNLAAAPKAFELADIANTFSADQLNKMLEKMLPGYAGLRDKGTENIAAFLRGEIPKDVERLIEQRAAEKGVRVGTSGSEFQKFDTLRNLGLTSLDITQRGLDSASRWIAAAPKAPQFDFTSMFFTPQQRLSFEFAQEQANLPIRSFNNWVESLPSNMERGLATAMDYSINVGTSFGESWLGAMSPGGMMGGGGNFPQVNSAGVNAGGGGGGYLPEFSERGPQ